MTTADNPTPGPNPVMRIECPMCKKRRSQLLIVSHPRAPVACPRCAVELIMNDGTMAMGPVKLEILRLVARKFKKFQAV